MPDETLEEIDLSLIREKSEPGSGPRRSLNSTAYRIFKLLQWLIEAPLTVPGLNQKFLEDANIRKRVSPDTVWLYINTLKALGCVIRRPSPRNGFCYEMISHPFGLTLDERQLETLAQAKIMAQHHFTHQEMLTLDGLLRKVVSQDGYSQQPELVDNLFQQTRSLDSQECRLRVEQLESAILAEDLLQVTYLSPLKGEERFCFLPESIFYRQGVIYVRGERPEYPEPSNLRLDRMLLVQPLQDDSLRKGLRLRQALKTEVILRVFVDSPHQFQGFSLDPDQGVYQETRLWVEGSKPHYEVRLVIRDSFYLRQTLLSMTIPFAILAPTSFRDEFASTLRNMLDFYQIKGESLDGSR